MQLHWHETPAFRFAPSADQVIDPKVRANVGRLKDYGLSFDLQLFPAQMKDGLALVGENPETELHSDPCRHADRRDATTDDHGRRAAHTRRRPNFYAKLSGLGTFAHRNDPALIAYIVDRRDRNLWQRPPDVRLELPDRKTLDEPSGLGCCTSKCCGQVQPRRTSRHLLRNCSKGLSTTLTQQHNFKICAQLKTHGQREEWQLSSPGWRNPTVRNRPVSPARELGTS